MHIKTIENLAQHFNIVNIISDVIKNAIYRQTRTLNKSFSEKNMTLQVNCQKNTRTETGVVVD